MRWIGDSQVEAILKEIPNISGLIVKGSEGVFKFHGSEEELAALLTRLTSSGVRIVSFVEVKQTIEDLYMKISTHGTM